MKRMLFNATQAEELRVAIVDGQKLVDLDIEYAGKEQRKSNIYKGVITRVEPSLEAAFVDYGSERHGFLPFKEISRVYLKGEDGEFARSRIQSILKEGQELIVQVDKDERGNKGAALTTYVSLAGRYLVLMPNNPRGGGVSRRVEGDERTELRDVMSQLEVPNGMSIIARTAGIGRAAEELQWDLNYLMQLWRAIEDASTSQKGAFLIYQEGSLVIRAIRDLFQPDIGEILVDTEALHEQAQQFMSHVMPDNVNKVKLYRDDVPLFSRFQIEHQIETAYRRDVNLPSGGAIIIDHTEALVSVDVNSARATRGADIEQTALNTNLEAADEIARQLRLRDLGGLVVIDFIDMESPRNQRDVENRLKDALKPDRARVQTGKISRFGLMELSRQRLQPSLGETSHTPCPRCGGTGHIRDIESSALHILRILQEEAMKEHTALLRAQVPVDVATFLLNEKRADIHALEARLKVSIVLIPNPHIETPNYEVERIKQDALGDAETEKPSYQLVNIPTEEVNAISQAAEVKAVRPQAAVQGITPTQPAPMPVAIVPSVEVRSSLIGRIMGWFKGDKPAPETAAPAKRTPPSREARPNAGSTGQSQRGERSERSERRPRRERPEPRPQNAEATETSDRDAERGNRQNRPPRPPRPQQQDAEAKITAAPVAVEAPLENTVPREGAEGAREGRNKRGRRGGRRERGERHSEPRNGQENLAFIPADQLEAQNNFSAEPATTQDMPRLETESYRSAPQPVPVQVSEETLAHEPVVSPVVSAPALAEMLPSSPPEMVREQVSQPVSTAAEGVSANEPSVEDPARPRRGRRRRPYGKHERPAATELVFVETDPNRIPSPEPIQNALENPDVQRDRPARRRNRELPPSEPLMQVETQKSDSIN